PRRRAHGAGPTEEACRLEVPRHEVVERQRPRRSAVAAVQIAGIEGHDDARPSARGAAGGAYPVRRPVPVREMSVFVALRQLAIRVVLEHVAALDEQHTTRGREGPGQWQRGKRGTDDDDVV